MKEPDEEYFGRVGGDMHNELPQKKVDEIDDGISMLITLGYVNKSLYEEDEEYRKIVRNIVKVYAENEKKHK